MASILPDWLKSRRVTNRVRWAIDNLLPPVVSDARWFNKILVKAMYGDRPFDLDFKEKALSMTPAELEAYYNRAAEHTPYRETDTTPGQHDVVVERALGPRVLELGCGNGSLSADMARRGLSVTATDLKKPWLDRLAEEYAGEGLDLRFEVASAEELPYEDGSFDTVVTTHMLEHVVPLEQCVREIRRVARRRILIVVPCQKYKRYTIDTHVHFFPTEAVLRFAMGFEDADVRKVDGDWVLEWNAS